MGLDFLVVSRISIPDKDRTLPCWNYLRSLGHNVWVEHPGSAAIPGTPDVIISMGVSIMEETFDAIKRFPNAWRGFYQWDTYKGILENPRPRSGNFAGEYDYAKYGKLLGLANEIWVPSECTGRRVTQWWGHTHWKVILSSCPWWDHPNVHDGGYALLCLREIPDPWWGVFERCCDELKIPYRCTRHEVSYADYQDAVAGCRFLCAPLYELSTGGLSLMEGYRLGKPVLLSDSEWNGARDYFGDRANYFRHGDEDDFRRQLWRLWANPPPVAPDHKEYIEANFSDRRMVDEILARVKAHGVGA